MKLTLPGLKSGNSLLPVLLAALLLVAIPLRPMSLLALTLLVDVASRPHSLGSGAGDEEGEHIPRVDKGQSRASGSGTGGGGVSGGGGGGGGGAGDGEGKPISKVEKGRASGSGTGGGGSSGGGSSGGGRSESGGGTTSGAIKMRKLRRRLRGSSSDQSAAGADPADRASSANPVANNLQTGRRLKVLSCLYRHKWVFGVTGFAGTLVGCGFHLPDLPMESVSKAYRPVANKFFHFSYLWAGSMLISFLARFVFRRARERLRRVRRLPAQDLEAGRLPAIQA